MVMQNIYIKCVRVKTYRSLILLLYLGWPHLEVYLTHAQGWWMVWKILHHYQRWHRLFQYSEGRRLWPEKILPPQWLWHQRSWRKSTCLYHNIIKYRLQRGSMHLRSYSRELRSVRSSWWHATRSSRRNSGSSHWESIRDSSWMLESGSLSTSLLRWVTDPRWWLVIVPPFSRTTTERVNNNYHLRSLRSHLTILQRKNKFYLRRKDLPFWDRWLTWYRKVSWLGTAIFCSLNTVCYLLIALILTSYLSRRYLYCWLFLFIIPPSYWRRYKLIFLVLK